MSHPITIPSRSSMDPRSSPSTASAYAHAFEPSLSWQNQRKDIIAKGLKEIFLDTFADIDKLPEPERTKRHIEQRNEVEAMAKEQFWSELTKEREARRATSGVGGSRGTGGSEIANMDHFARQAGRDISATVADMPMSSASGSLGRDSFMRRPEEQEGIYRSLQTSAEAPEPDQVVEEEENVGEGSDVVEDAADDEQAEELGPVEEEEEQDAAAEGALDMEPDSVDDISSGDQDSSEGGSEQNVDDESLPEPPPPPPPPPISISTSPARYRPVQRRSSGASDHRNSYESSPAHPLLRKGSRTMGYASSPSPKPAPSPSHEIWTPQPEEQSKPLLRRGSTTSIKSKSSPITPIRPQSQSPGAGSSSLLTTQLSRASPAPATILETSEEPQRPSTMRRVSYEPPVRPDVPPRTDPSLRGNHVGGGTRPYSYSSSRSGKGKNVARFEDDSEEDEGYHRSEGEER